MKKHKLWNEKNILVVEDDVASAEYLVEILDAHGCNVLKAMDGHEAIDLFYRNTFDLILLDIQLPGMDGYEIAKTIRSVNPSVPIIVQTARDLFLDREKCRLSGCNDYLLKPIAYAAFVALVSGYLVEG